LYQGGDFSAKTLFDATDGKIAFPHRPVQNRRHQALIGEAQFGENFGHLQAGEKAADIGVPQLTLGLDLLFNVGSKIACFLQHCGQLRGHAGFSGNAQHPAVHIDLVAFMEIVYFSCFNHNRGSPDYCSRDMG